MPRRGVIVAGNFQDVHWLRAAMELAVPHYKRLDSDSDSDGVRRRRII